ncbi:DUF4158 domain-containing protein [Nocardia sp. alder85J]|nr:DUF4158 domain-containing protein [Nocardia sp. alder85J]
MRHLIRSYGKRAQTRTEHLRLAAQYLGWRTGGSMELKELDEFLLARAMEHDSPTLLFRLGCEYRAPRGAAVHIGGGMTPK